LAVSRRARQAGNYRADTILTYSGQGLYGTEDGLETT